MNVTNVINIISINAVCRKKLTWKLILELPTGVFVVSNLYPHGRSVFAEKMQAPEMRLSAWKRAVAAGAAHRLCQVLRTDEEFVKAAFPAGMA